jgi:hypothetical protein
MLYNMLSKIEAIKSKEHEKKLRKQRIDIKLKKRRLKHILKNYKKLNLKKIHAYSYLNVLFNISFISPSANFL